MFRNKLHIFRIRSTFIISFLFVFSNIALYGQDIKEIETNEIKLPVLNNHKFITNSQTRSPFIKTYYKNTLGIGRALDLQLPILDLDGNPILGLRGNLLFIGLDFEYQYAVNDWLAIWLNYGIISRIGDGPQALLAQGVNATTSSELGWMFKLLETKKVFLSTTLIIWNSSGTIINFYDYLKRIIEEGEVAPDNQLVITRNFIQLGGGFRFAWAASDLFGVNALTEFAYGESVDRRNEKELFYNLAVSTDFDLNNVAKVPIGFALGLKINSFLSGSDTSIKGKVTSIFLKTAYTGEDDFLIGIDFVWRKMPMSQIDQTLYGGSLNLNVDYYF